MKKLLILTLLVFSFFTGKAQNNYLLSGSVDGVKITETGSGLLMYQTYTDTSEVTASQKLWFVSPRGFDNGSMQWFQAGMLNVTLTNISLSWKKISLYDFTKTSLIRTINIAPNATIYWDINSSIGQEDKRLDASKNYYWKIESLSTQTPTIVNDAISLQASNVGYIDVLDNDLNLPAGAECRLKSGQTLAGITVTKDQYTGLKVSTGSSQGTYTFIYEAVASDGTNVLGQAVATITVIAPSQYCTIAVLSNNLLQDSKTIYEFVLHSPNANINPFTWEIRSNSISGTIVKTGTTPPATSNKELIDFGTLPTGTYYVKISSTISNCYDIKSIEHVSPNDVCNLSIISIDKVSGTNNYTVNTAFSGTSTIKYNITNAQISGTISGSGSGIATQTFIATLPTSASGTYFINIEGEGSKVCKAQKSFEHTLVITQNGSGKLESWTKVIHNYKDNWIISGKDDNASGRDKFGMWSTTESNTNVVWKAFISDFENEGNSPLAKALIGFRKDTTRNEVGVSVAVTPTSLQIRQRATKSGAYNTLATISNITAPVWIRLTKTGNTLVADYSKDLNMNPVWTEIGTVQNAFAGWTRYQKYLGTTSYKPDVLASARFQGQLGGIVNFSSPTINISAPAIITNNSNPTNGQSVMLSTSTSCIAPAVNKWYKNTDNTSFSSGSTVNVTAYNSDYYYSKCENGLNKSIASNIISFNISNLLSCNNGGSFDILSVVYANGSTSFVFNASGLTNGTYSILNANEIVKSGSFYPTSPTVTVNTGSISNGNYIFKIDGVSCSGTAQKTFNISDSAPTNPTLTSAPTSPVANDNVVLTASGCNGTYNFQKNGALFVISSTGILNISSAVASDYYSVICSATNLQSNTITINSLTTNGGQQDVSKVLHPNGKILYNQNGTVNFVAINPVISNDYLFSETVNRGCSQGTLRYSFDEGDYTGSHVGGWKNYPVTNIDLSAMQGKTLLFTSACVGEGATPLVVDIHTTYIYLKRNPNVTTRNTSQLTYVNYANNFVPNFTTNLPTAFSGSIPAFSLNHKSNIYEGTHPTNAVNFDMRNLGIVAWHRKRGGIQTFPESLGYITDGNDTWAAGLRPNSTSPSLNSLSISDVQNRANTFSAYGQQKFLFSDDEWRQGESYNQNGIDNMYAFYKRAKELLPNTIISAHHNSPYTFDKNNDSDSEIKGYFDGTITNERQMFSVGNPGFLGQYWQDVSGKTSGDNTGNTLFGAISLNDYVHYHNPTYSIYKSAQEALVHKKFYPNKKILNTIEGFLEIESAYYSTTFEYFSWKTSANSAERMGSSEVPISASHLESTALVANITGDGVNFWGDFLTRQDTRPDMYYQINSAFTASNVQGYTSPDVATTYGNYAYVWKGEIDYLFLGLHKFSQIPTNYDFTNPILYEISTDGGVTWINNYNNVPGILLKNQKPMAIGVKNSAGKHAIVAVYPYNSPIQTYTFKIRTTGMDAIDITVDGHFPQLILNNNSVQ